MIEASFKENQMYAGHHQDGSGIQNHSVGPLYPYVVGVRERNIDGTLIRSWILLGGKIRGELEFRTEKDAVEAAHTLLAEKAIRTKAARPASLQSLVMSHFDAAFDRIHDHNQREWSRFQAQRSSIQ